MAQFGGVVSNIYSHAVQIMVGIANFIDKQWSLEHEKDIIRAARQDAALTEQRIAQVDSEILNIANQIEEKKKEFNALVAAETKIYTDTAVVAAIAAVAGLALSFTGRK